MVATAVGKTVSLPPDLARDAEEAARAEGKTPWPADGDRHGVGPDRSL